MLRKISILFICNCFLLTLTAQTDGLTDSLSLETDSMLIKMDSIPPTDSIQIVNLDSLATDTSSAPKINRRKPQLAIMWSALYPGFGQAYNKQYWKTPIYAGMFTTGLVYTVRFRKDFKLYREDYLSRINDPLNYVSPFDDSNAQILTKRIEAKRQYNMALAGTILVYSFNLLDAYTSNLIKQRERPHSPVKSAFRSAIIPGWGQAYNKKYWKIPIVYGGLLAGGWYIRDNYRKMNAFTHAYINRNNPSYPIENVIPDSPTRDGNTLLQWRENSRNKFEVGIIVTTIWYVANILDATVDGHLFEFEDEMNDDLSFNINPYFEQNEFHGNKLGLSLNLKF